MGVKEAVYKLLDTLPHDATIEDIQYHLYVLQKIQAGQEAVDAGEKRKGGQTPFSYSIQLLKTKH